jgi:hypothetical protein
MRLIVGLNRGAQIRAGFEPRETATVDVDLAKLSEQDRVDLAQVVGEQGRVPRHYWTATGTQADSVCHVPQPTAEDVLKIVRRIAQAERDREAWKLAEAAKLQTQRREQTTARARQAAEAAARESRLKEWAQEHGSQLLQKRLEGGWHWQSLARREYADQAVAGISLEPCECAGEIQERTRPKLLEISTLQSVRAALPAGCSADLQWLRVDEVDSEDHPFLRVTVTTPDGKVILARDYHLPAEPE